MELSPGARYVLDCLDAAGFCGWAVGGCVRDALRGVPPHDFDIAANAPPQALLECFPGARVLPTGLAHGTVTVLWQNEPVEVTTLRRDGDYADGRRPRYVTFVDSITEDLSRRDFTVNAMAWNPQSGLCDPFGGRCDLQNGVLRCVGDPFVRFEEDRLRILRAARFAAVLGFSVETQTAAAMHKLAPSLTQASAERIGAELQKLLCGPYAGPVIRAHKTILEAILQKYIQNVDFAADTVALLPPDAVLRLAALLPCDRYAAAQTADKLRLSRAQGRRLGDLCVLRGQAAHNTPEQAAAVLARIADCHAVRQLALSGRDLATLGVPPGKAMGTLLERLLAAVAQGCIDNTRENLLVLAKQMWYNVC